MAKVVGRVAVRVWPDTRAFGEEMRKGLKRAERENGPVKVRIVTDGKLKERVRSEIETLNALLERARDARYTVRVKVVPDFKSFVSSLKRGIRDMQSEANKHVVRVPTEIVQGAHGERLGHTLVDAANAAARMDDSQRSAAASAVRQAAASGVVAANLRAAQKVANGAHLKPLSDGELKRKWDAEYAASRKFNKSAHDNFLKLRREALLKYAHEAKRHRVEQEYRLVNGTKGAMRAKLDQLLGNKPLRPKRIGVRPVLEDRWFAAMERKLARANERAARMGLKADRERVTEIKRRMERDLGIMSRRTMLPSRVELKTVLNRRSRDKAKGSLRKDFGEFVSKIKPVVDNRAVASMRQVFSQLSGARLLGRTYDKLLSPLKNIDIAIPKVGALALGFVSLSSAVIHATGALFAFGGAISQIALGAVALPGIFVGAAVGAAALGVGLSDLNRRMPEVGEAFKRMGQEMKATYWSQTLRPFRALAKDTLPVIRRGMNGVSKEAGIFSARMAESLRKFVTPRMAAQFESVRHSFLALSTGTDGLAKVVAVLGTLGEKYLPKLSKAVADLFNSWGNRMVALEKDGTLQRWVDRSVYGIRQVARTLASIGGILAGISRAALRVKSDPLAGFAKAMERLNRAVNGERFQKGFSALLAAAEQASQTFWELAGGPLGKVMSMLGGLLTKVMPIVGHALGTAVGAIAKALSSPDLQNALYGLFVALDEVITQLAPHFDTLGQSFAVLLRFISTALRAFTPLVETALLGAGSLLETVGPDLEKVVVNLADALNNLLQSALPGLRQFFPAISGLLVWVSKGIADFVRENKPELRKLFDTLGVEGPKVIESLKGPLGTIGRIIERVVKEALPIIRENLPKWANGLRSAIEGLDKALNALERVIGKFIDAGGLNVIASQMGMMETAGAALKWTLGGLSGALAMMSGLFGSSPMDLNAFRSGLEAAGVEIGWFFDRVGEKASSAFGKVKEFFGWGEVTKEWKDGTFSLTTITSAYVETEKRIFRGLFDAWWWTIRAFWGAAWDGMKAFWERLPEPFREALRPILEWFSQVPESIKGIWGSLSDWFGSLGSNLMTNLVNGLRSVMPELDRTIQETVNRLANIPMIGPGVSIVAEGYNRVRNRNKASGDFTRGGSAGGGASGMVMHITNNYPQAEKTSVTVNRAAQYAGLYGG